MKKMISIIFACIFLVSCKENKAIGIIGGADGPTAIIVADSSDKKGDTQVYSYETITQEKAKEIMDSGVKHTILDVREQEEFDEGHIPGAILIPHLSINELAEKELSDKNELILVYCRSGRRSKIASEALAKLGYSNVKEFGGIIDWQYDIVK